MDGVPDARLGLIDRVWLRDGDLDLFIAWLCAFGALPLLGEFEQLTGSQTDPTRTPLDAAWYERQQEAAERRRYPTPIPGGSDPLHLSMHCDGPLRHPYDVSNLLPTSADLYLSHAGISQATFVTDSMLGWYRYLLLHANELPRGGQDWEIDVFVKPVGWLGTYRRSPSTSNGETVHGALVLATTGDGTALLLDAYVPGPAPSADADWGVVGDYAFSALWGIVA